MLPVWTAFFSLPYALSAPFLLSFTLFILKHKAKATNSPNMPYRGSYSSSSSDSSSGDDPTYINDRRRNGHRRIRSKREVYVPRKRYQDRHRSRNPGTDRHGRLQEGHHKRHTDSLSSHPHSRSLTGFKIRDNTRDLKDEVTGLRGQKFINDTAKHFPIVRWIPELLYKVGKRAGYHKPYSKMSKREKRQYDELWRIRT